MVHGFANALASMVFGYYAAHKTPFIEKAAKKKIASKLPVKKKTQREIGGVLKNPLQRLQVKRVWLKKWTVFGFKVTYQLLQILNVCVVELANLISRESDLV